MKILSDLAGLMQTAPPHPSLFDRFYLVRYKFFRSVSVFEEKDYGRRQDSSFGRPGTVAFV